MGAFTALYGVIGYPVRHSLSPLMQTAALRARGLDAVYLAFEVAPEKLGEAVRGAYALGVTGLSVTVPHKVSVMGFIDEIDEGARAIGAVNTLVRGPRGWKGHNTDAAGFTGSARRELGFSAAASSALVLGAGGAARAVICGLAKEGVKCIYIAARRGEAAEGLAGELNAALGGLTVKPVAMQSAPGLLKAGDMVVSATPLGLSKEAKWPFEMKSFAEGVLFYDTAYGKGETPLEKEAKALGFKAVSGRGMLAGQGAEAFALWTGLEAPLELMEEVLKNHVGR
ncbi:shikimate dehydrogenase [bacterium]|nr:MAG: shikimate dehydrogenase [bacterium]